MIKINEKGEIDGDSPLETKEEWELCCDVEFSRREEE